MALGITLVKITGKASTGLTCCRKILNFANTRLISADILPTSMLASLEFPTVPMSCSARWGPVTMAINPSLSVESSHLSVIAREMKLARPPYFEVYEYDDNGPRLQDELTSALQPGTLSCQDCAGRRAVHRNPARTRRKTAFAESANRCFGLKNHSQKY